MISLSILVNLIKSHILYKIGADDCNEGLIELSVGEAQGKPATYT